MVSIIITTKYSENFIADCINAVKNSNYKYTEIILVDNNSTDRWPQTFGTRVYLLAERIMNRK